MIPRKARRRLTPAIANVPPVRTWRTERVAKWFGLPTGPQANEVETPPQTPPLPETGQVVLLTGASGSGKSTLLRRMTATLEERGTRVIDLARLVLPDVPVVDCFPDVPLEAALVLLGRMGLGEAWTYLRTPSELSDGQRWRLRLAIAIDLAEREADSVVLVCDEFAALLDRVTAAVVSRSIRKLVDRSPGLAALLATCHEDVVGPLAPARVVRCDFGETETAANDQ